jgi:probable O-glycosylation ligase (exosortase A-associated)
MVLRAPSVGLLAWIWIALMSPNREVHGFLYGAPLNLFVAALTGLSWISSRERKDLPLNAFPLLLLAFLGWATICTVFALDRPQALPIWSRTAKTVILALAVMMLATTRVRLQATIWMIVVSLGFYGVKGGGFTLLGGGRNHVFGPEASMIEDNNSLGLALVLILPLLNYLRLTSARPLVRAALLGTLALTLVAILGTYSRGALIALAAAGAAYALRARNGPLLLAAGAVAAVALPALMPERWLERMSTIQTAGQDESFQARLAAWTTSLDIALARPLIGGGFAAIEQTWIVKTFSSAGGLVTGRAAHSIYFQVLGDTGFVGLFLYLSAVGAAVMNTFRVLAATRDRPQLAWAAHLARMLQVSLAGFLAGGAALSMAYYDGLLVVLAVTTGLVYAVAEESVAGPVRHGPKWRTGTRRSAFASDASPPLAHSEALGAAPDKAG